METVAERLKIEPAAFKGLTMSEIAVCIFAAFITAVVSAIFVITLVSIVFEIEGIAVAGIMLTTVILVTAVVAFLLILYFAKLKNENASTFLAEKFFLWRQMLFGNSKFFITNGKDNAIMIWSRSQTINTD